MIGVQSSLIMFPINILIVSIFRHTRPREPPCCKSKRDRADVPGQTSFPRADTRDVNDTVTLESVMKVCVFWCNYECKMHRFYPVFVSGDVGYWVFCHFGVFLPQDIERITHSLSKTVKSNIPCTEFGPEQQTNINAVLSVVEGFIKQKPGLAGESQLGRVSLHGCVCT